MAGTSYSTTANLYTHLTAGVKERAAEALENAFGLKNKNKNNIFVVSFLVLEFFVGNLLPVCWQ